MYQNQKDHIRKQLGLQVLIVFKIQSEPENFVIVNKVIEALLAKTTVVFYFMEDGICKKVQEINNKGIYKVFVKKDHADHIDLIITVGGDGTILYTAKEFQKMTPPFLTIQKGTLGFLCKFKPENIESTMNMAVHQLEIRKIRHSKSHDHHHSHLKAEKDLPISNGNENEPFEISRLMRLKGTVIGKGKVQKSTKVVLNQVAITRKDCNRIVLQILIDDELITTTSGDGILVSTPTGSTAYALSAGGPVVVNGVNTIMLVPIAPNSLSFRPICIPSTSVIRLKLSNKSKSYALISFDGQTNLELTEDDEIRIYHEVGEKNSDLVLFQPKQSTSGENLPTWMQRLKLFLGWNEVFKSPTCEVMSKNIDKIQ